MRMSFSSALLTMRLLMSCARGALWTVLVALSFNGGCRWHLLASIRTVLCGFVVARLSSA
jgi:ABC-type nitrate/sulfonate/bicarbonate transport system permease component